jgi:fimbrial isopeptide formation D2 family protein/uncharacterized repeat protein (TIGR01451 family)
MLLLVGLVSVATRPPVARAEANRSPSYGGVVGAQSNTFYAYVEDGETLDLSFALAARDSTGASRQMTYRVTDPSGAVLWTCTIAATAAIGRTCSTTGLTGASGAWKIEVVAPATGAGTGYDWNITVRDGGSAVPGRVWVDKYVTYQPAQANTADMRYWLVNDSGYIYDTRLDGYDGIGSTITADAVGNVGTRGGCDSVYRSLEVADRVSSGECGQYRIFFQEPSNDLPATAPSADGTLTVKPAPLSESDLAVDDLSFKPTSGNSAAGTFSYSITDRFVGGYQLQIDTNGNGSYDDAVDRTIDLSADGSGKYTYDFDGKDGNGDAIADCTAMNARIFYDRVGEIHVTNNDVEGRTGGIQMTRTNGSGAPDSTIYFDDRQLANDRANTTPVRNGTAGVDSTGGVHGWAFDGNSWGNNRVIDDWAYNPINLGTGEISLAGKCLTVDKTSSAGDSSKAGDTVTYTVKVKNVGGSDYTADDPASMTDDLSDVLDDATYNGDAKVSFSDGSSSDAPSVDGKKLSWSGPLKAGETATITYSVTVKAGGNGEVINNACIPAADAQDPDNRCASTETDVPQLSIKKTADTTELPRVGDTVTYTVTATNKGPGDYTADDPAVVDDDLTNVLDDATLDESSISASVGDAPTYKAPLVSWTGPLASGDSVKITYKVTYTGAGDKRLVNVAWEPTNPHDPTPPACDPADANGRDPKTGEPCGRVVIPAADLQVVKSVDPQDGSTVTAGEKLTYTITFSNDGTAAADVDGWTDDLAGVLDDAKITSGPTASNDDLTVSDVTGGNFTVNGTVPAGKSYTVKYTVTVLPDGQRGDDRLNNFVVKPGDTPPGPDDECVDGDPLCTSNPVPQIDVTKTVDPQDGSTVQPGQVLTYTLTFTNSGKAAGDVSKVDDLSQLTDDAKITKDPVASDPALKVSAIKNDQFTITGGLKAGQTVTVSYQATVNATDDLGDADLGNFVINPGDTPPSTPDCKTGDPTCTENPAPKISDSKSVDPKDGSTVTPGQKLTYTLTFTNSGKAAGDVDKVDDLSQLVDDATITSDPKASDDALTVSKIANNQFTIKGSLKPGQTVKVTYQATVKDQDQLGDTQLANFLINPGDQPPNGPGDCKPGDPTCTDNPAPKISDHKSVDPESGSSVKPGQVLTYTLTFSNDGQGAGKVDRVDDLTHVLDDAEVTGAPKASDKALTVSGINNDRYHISGTLKPGQTVTVSYKVTVNSAKHLGDSELANFILDPNEPTPHKPVCDGGDDCTYNPVSDIAVVKSADPKSGTAVGDGRTVTYTLTFTNAGKATGSVNYTDHLAKVLDDADLVGDATASDPALAVAHRGDDLVITGDLAAGQTVTVTYRAKVKAYANQGDHELDNFVTVTGQQPPKECVSGSQLCTEHPTEKPNPPAPAPDGPGGLAQTGSPFVALPAALIGLAMLVSGGWVLSRRNRFGLRSIRKRR